MLPPDPNTVLPAAPGPLPADAAAGPANSGYTPTIEPVEALLSLFSEIREQVDARRVLLLSNLALAFSIPLATVNVQQVGAFSIPKIFIFPRPNVIILISWLLGVLFMTIGAALLMREFKSKAAKLGKKQPVDIIKLLEVSIDALRGSQSHLALEPLGALAEHAKKQFVLIRKSQILFYLGIFCFLFTTFLEFSVILFQPQPPPDSITLQPQSSSVRTAQ